MDDLERLWPPFGLRISCGDVELRVLRDADIPDLLALKHEGIVEPDLPMPFPFPWHLGGDRESLIHWWTQRAHWGKEQWSLPFVVRAGGEIAGVQDMMNKSNAAVTRSLETGSWLGLRFHRRGIGTRMRQLVAAFAFDQLGMTELRSEAHEGNAASLGVSKKCGYVPDGTKRVATAEGTTTLVRLLLTPDRFVRPAEEITYAGVEEFKTFAGLADLPA